MFAMPDPAASPVPVLIADDDEEDRMLARDALVESRLANPLFFVHDGVELLDFLHRRGQFQDPSRSPRPGIILLDINMPRMTGLEALREIKRDPSLRRIPVVILTTSRADEDIIRSYDLGVNSFISKPVTFDGLVDVMRLLGTYWFEIVDLAPGSR
jgi:CheY-like chemotaxis protein